MRKARVLTKKPIKPSSSCWLRFAEGTPITTSSCPDRRINNSDQAASRFMNSVVPCCVANARRRAVSARSNTSGTKPPR